MSGGVKRFIPHLAGSLLLAGAGAFGLLDRWEGRKQFTVYPDTLAGGLPTVCRGLTRHVTSTPILVGEVWSEEKCRAEEQVALTRVQLRLAACFRLLPTQDVFDAATSHAWNLGTPATCGSAAMAAFNRGEWALGCRRLSRGDDGRIVWSFVSRIGAKGERELMFVQGLANRRADETRYCLSGVPA